MDNVNSPRHYQHAGIETIEYIAAVLGPQGFEAYCIGNVIKYVSRYQWKGGVEDLQEARVYLDWAIGDQEQAEEPEVYPTVEDAIDALAELADEEPPLRAGKAFDPPESFGGGE